MWIMYVLSWACILTIYYFIITYILYTTFCTVFSQKNGLQEWSIVELQGDLEVRGSQDMQGQFIGDLSYDKYGQPVSQLIAIKTI